MMRGTALSLVLGMLAVPPAAAQTVRITGAAQARYIELRPLVSDSIDATLVSGSGLLQQTADGRVVRCLPGEPYCRDVHPGELASTIPLIQDVEISAWGFGRGTYAFAQLRGRSALSGSELWPQADDAFDVLAAYVEFARSRFRVRGGRQWKVSGLGFYNFDGVSLEVQPLRAASIEVYGGRSLMRGLNETRTSGALESVEALAPSAAGLLLGVHARYQRNRQFGIGALYQVDFRNDGGGLYAELFAADAAAQIGRFETQAALEVDVASAAINEARLRVRSPPLGHFVFHAELRRYRPYFELWTIWGAFSPVGYDEAAAGATWADDAGTLIVQGEAIRRGYDAAATDPAFGDLRQAGWGASVSANWLPSARWRINAGYRADAGFGAARRQGYAGAALDVGDRASVAVQAIAFERLYEFRLDDGVVVGLGAEAALRASERIRISANGALYRHLRDDAAAVSAWNQRRAGLRVEWTVGSEPRVLPVQP